MVHHLAECNKKANLGKKIKTISASCFLTWSAQILQKVSLGYYATTAK